MKRIPWEEIRKRYENEKASYQQLGEEFGISRKTISAHARAENWVRGGKIPNAADVCLSSATRQLARRLEQAESGEEVNMGEIKELTTVLRDLVKVREALTATEDRENCVQVVMDEEIEEWSK